MLKKESTDMFQAATAPDDIAVIVDSVSKTFTQWQRKEKASGENSALKNKRRSIFRQEKKIVTALDNVSFRIRRGEFAAYAGPNGAGKSTTMKLLSGMLQPTDGKLSVLGMSPEKDRIALMKRLGVLFGNRTELWWDHPVIQSFEWKKVVWDIPDAVYRRNLDMMIKLLDIDEIQNTFARELSLGQRMRADLAMMLLHSPELILLDEPTLGLDVVAKRQMIEFLKKINREEGVTILVTSHDMDDLEEMAQRILMISNGKLAFDGSFDGLREITGNLTHFTVTTDGRRPDLEGCKLLSEKHGVFEFEVDLSRLSIKVLLEQLSHADGIMDVEIRKAPIEQVITQLYQAWKNT
ncbi:MAG: ATP-binding cassette domain-containing protein [Lachnospiraceae bacterium]|nr:ATP-binding cassette domain-containing protein [Lachnospiraceae bacterium]